MSNATYDELWKEAHVLLEEVAQLDSMAQSSPGMRDRGEARAQLAHLYVLYIYLGNKFEQCYDLVVQPQKRLVLRRLLDSTYGRILELKHELVEVELSEYNYFDDVLLELSLQMTPDELELKVPRYICREREAEISTKRNFIEKTLRSLGDFENKFERKKMTELEAIRLIQAHERARQGRMKFQFMKEILEIKEKSTIRSELKEPDTVTATAAALKIQKAWRGYNARCKVHQSKLDEMILIGMAQPYETISESSKQLEKIIKERYKVQEEFQKTLVEYMGEAKERIKAEKSAIMEENIRIEIRNWIKACYKQTGKIPELPSVESGGSRIIFCRQETESTISKSTGVCSSKESKRSKKSFKTVTKKESETEQQSEFASTGFKANPSNFLQELIQADQEYQDVWKDKNESANLNQGPYFEMVEAEKTQEIENEVRITVDQALRADIEALQVALDKDKGGKGKRAKKTQKRVRRSGKKNKRKKEKDLTPDRSTESLFEELLQQGIIKLYPEVHISSFKGQKSYMNQELRRRGKDPLPSIGDIRQIIIEYCILPLGSDILHQLTPLVRSILIAGPKGSGKKMLVNAICTELGATLFDITPSNIVGKYPGKSGLIMLLHLISKVSKLLQPSVIFMEGAEKPFVKKVPKNDKTDPKRLKKDLSKLIKTITNDDRVILIGISRTPWEGDQKLIYQTYDKVIFIPRPDYGSMSLIWKDLLYKYPGISRQFNTSGMAKLCDGFTIGTVQSAIHQVMTTKRMVQLRIQPLTPIELIKALSMKNPIYREEEDTFLNWYSRTPTCKKKQKAIEIELAKLEEEMEKKKKKKK